MVDLWIYNIYLNLVVMSISRLLVFQRIVIYYQMCSYIHIKLILHNIYKRVSSSIKNM